LQNEPAVVSDRISHLQDKIRQDSLTVINRCETEDELALMMKPELRQEFASYISQQSAIAGYKTLVPENLQKASNLAVANLYWYFKVREESETEVEVEAVTA
jgi:hypothetical protein